VTEGPIGGGRESITSRRWRSCGGAGCGLWRLHPAVDTLLDAIRFIRDQVRTLATNTVQRVVDAGRHVEVAARVGGEDRRKLPVSRNPLQGARREMRRLYDRRQIEVAARVDLSAIPAIEPPVGRIGVDRARKLR